LQHAGDANGEFPSTGRSNCSNRPLKLDLRLVPLKIVGSGKTHATEAASTKPPIVKAAVIACYREGKSKAQVVRGLRIDPETVTRILDEPGIREAVEASRS
jgi:hypothetical protein